jgi:hypothetical protein
MRAKDYPALVDAIESGVACGLARAEKHADDPLTDAQRERLREHIADQMLSAICERFDLDAPHD